MKTKWMLDGKINLTEIGEQSEWHNFTMIQKLMGLGLSHRDAEAFAAFIGNEYCAEADGITDTDSEDYVTQEQYDRLSVA